MRPAGRAAPDLQSLLRPLATLTAERGLAAGHREMLAARPVVMTDPKDWAAHLRRNRVDSRRAVTLATEGALIGGLDRRFNGDRAQPGASG